MKVGRGSVQKREIETARHIWPNLSNVQAEQLAYLVCQYRVSVSRGDLHLIEGKWYVTHSGLLRLSHRKDCLGIRVQPVRGFCDSASARWAFKATVFTSNRCKGFMGFGDADPTNVSPLMHGAEMRIAETRAVNRALRKAYGIGICSVEEIGSLPQSHVSHDARKKIPRQSTNADRNRLQPRLRDRLCLLIRQHQLDPVLVKSYALEFCGTKSLSEATREQIERFITHLTDRVTTDKNALVAHLNSYGQIRESAA